VIQDATSTAAFGPIRAATLNLSYLATPSVIPDFDCAAVRAMMGKLIRQVICVPALELNLGPTSHVIRNAVSRVVDGLNRTLGLV